MKDKTLRFRIDAEFEEQCAKAATDAGLDVSHWLRMAASRQISAQQGICMLCKRPFSGEVGAQHIAQTHAAQHVEGPATAEPPKPAYVLPETVNAKVWLARVLDSEETQELKDAVSEWVRAMEPEDASEQRTPAGWQTLAERHFRERAA